MSSRPTQHQEHRLPCSSALWVRAEHRGAETLTEDTGLEEPGNWQEDLEEEQQSRCGQIRAHVPHIQHVKASGDRPLQPPRCHHRVERTVARDTATRHHPSASRGLPAGLCVSGGGVRRLLTCLVPFRRPRGVTSPLSLCTPVILVMPWARGPALMGKSEEVLVRESSSGFCVLHRQVHRHRLEYTEIHRVG